MNNQHAISPGRRGSCRRVAGAAFLTGLLLTAVSTAIAAPASLKTIAVPEPANLGKFVKNKAAAIRLGKALYWDMQVGSDGITACASCHFHAGADNRTRNQINPGQLAGDNIFELLAGPDHELTIDDYPFYRLVNVEDRSSGGVDPNDPAVLRSVSDVASSHGVVLRKFEGLIAGQGQEAARTIRDRTFTHDGRNVRQVEPRNAPTVINAVFNFTQFHDGRANHFFNGVNPFGVMDVNAHVWINNGTLQPLNLTENPTTNGFILDNASLASQAVGPPLSEVEMSWRGRSFPDVGRKLLPLRPLAGQEIHPQDSSLAGLRHAGGKGLDTTYEAMVRAAFQDQFWNNTVEKIGGYSQMETNFSLFFGLALQLYQATLVSDDSPFDRFMEGNAAALSERQQRGMSHFFSGGAACSDCHAGAEFTAATVSAARNPAEPGIIEIMAMGDGTQAQYDIGFYNIGVRPTSEDPGRGGVVAGLRDRNGNLLPPMPLSFSRQFALHLAGGLPFVPMGEPGCINDFLADPPNLCPSDLQQVTRTAADGAMKTPTLRNVELTGPYTRNGGKATLMQLVNFYVRGGDFHEANLADLDPAIRDINGLKNDPEKKEELVEFLISLTDERVRWEQAPFDHPQLFVTDGHHNIIPGNPKRTRLLVDVMKVVPAVGAAGRQAQGLPPLKPFLADNLEGVALSTFHFRP